MPHTTHSFVDDHGSARRVPRRVSNISAMTYVQQQCAGHLTYCCVVQTTLTFSSLAKRRGCRLVDKWVADNIWGVQLEPRGALTWTSLSHTYLSYPVRRTCHCIVYAALRCTAVVSLCRGLWTWSLRLPRIEGSAWWTLTINRCAGCRRVEKTFFQCEERTSCTTVTVVWNRNTGPGWVYSLTKGAFYSQ